MFGFITKTFMLLTVLALKPINPFPLIERITMTETSTPTTTYTENYPVVVLHGLESSSREMEPLCDWLETTFHRRVYNMEIGNGEKTSMYTSLSDQLDELCVSIYTLPELRKGFDFIGISQGGLLARGYVERCNSYPVRNLITLVAPHGGVFWPNTKNSGLMYNDFFQNHLSVASYWRNPTMIETYLTCCAYLPVINNEIWCQLESPTHRQNIRNLSNFVMIWSPMDTVVDPPESGKFSFFDEDFKVIPLEETDLYKNDLLGLKYLNKKGGLHTFETNCSHVDHRNPICFSQLERILKPFI
jgi:palmitoyl-protein thioesterase